jgi:hypothetical protein
VIGQYACTRPAGGRDTTVEKNPNARWNETDRPRDTSESILQYLSTQQTSSSHTRSHTMVARRVCHRSTLSSPPSHETEDVQVEVNIDACGVFSILVAERNRVQSVITVPQRPNTPTTTTTTSKWLPSRPLFRRPASPIKLRRSSSTIHDVQCGRGRTRSCPPPTTRDSTRTRDIRTMSCPPSPVLLPPKAVAVVLQRGGGGGGKPNLVAAAVARRQRRNNNNNNNNNKRCIIAPAADLVSGQSLYEC